MVDPINPMISQIPNQMMPNQMLKQMPIQIPNQMSNLYQMSNNNPYGMNNPYQEMKNSELEFIYPYFGDLGLI